MGLVSGFVLATHNFSLGSEKTGDLHKPKESRVGTKEIRDRSYQICQTHILKGKEKEIPALRTSALKVWE